MRSRLIVFVLVLGTCAPAGATYSIVARALEAAQAEGGDVRGQQSAALIVVAAAPTGRPWADRLFDLRVEDHPQPVKELRRLVTVQRAYNHVGAAGAAVDAGDLATARREYDAAVRLQPKNPELRFWYAVGLVSLGRREEALPLFKGVFADAPGYRIATPRLVKAGLLPDDEKFVARILAQ